MKLGYTGALATPRAQAVPVAQASLTAHLLSCNAAQLREEISELILQNPLVEPLSSEFEPAFPEASAPETLGEHLSSQLRINVTDRELLQVCLFLVYSLDRNGYLRESEEDVCRLCGCSRRTFQRALAQVQQLEPTGVGARSLSECLCLQLLARQPADELALAICRHHLEELAEGCLPPLGRPQAEVDRAVSLIRSLSPRPGSQFDSSPVPFLLPDLHVTNQDGQLAVELENQPQVPVLSPQCAALLHHGTEQEKQYIREHLASARSFFFAIRQRSSSLLTVASFAVRHQEDHLLSRRAVPLSPLTMTDTAQALSLSISTVSRAVKDKYVRYDGHIFPLRALFTSGGTAAASRQQIVQSIHAICGASPSRLSDQAVAALLRRQGIAIARRTVNKYRRAILQEGGIDP